MLAGPVVSMPFDANTQNHLLIAVPDGRTCT